MSHVTIARRDRMNVGRVGAAAGMSVLLLLGQSAPLLGNPTGGAVVAGAATIGSAGKTLTINQSSNLAIINWQTFSIASGETTKFFVPSSSSATLNRVLGGNPSAIFGTLSSNGQLFLINPAGIVVGAGGRIDTASFLGSTLNVSDDAFLKGGNLTFSGSSTAAIDNQGSINGSNGDVYLIANQVGNEGSLTAPQGNVGLAAASSVLYQQAGDQHLFIQPTPSGTTRATGVTNSGTIQAASAELRAAGGNAYALAINNSGSIVATGYKKINGQVYLTADTGAISNSGSIHATGKSRGGTVALTSQTGTITNSGLIDASATGRGGKGGSVQVKSTQGSVANTTTGVINAKGGTSGAGGRVEMSGGQVNPAGLVNTTSPHGQTGMFLIDPTTLTIAASGGDETGAQVAQMLSTSDVNLQASQTVTINDGITWSSTNALTLSTTATGSTIAINAPISGVNGGLHIAAKDLTATVTTGANGTINVGSFFLDSGFWEQNSATLAAFATGSDFEIASGAEFLRATGGSGTTNSPYTITDVYGLQGLGSMLTVSANLAGNINAAGTATWNSGAGFVPIGLYDNSDSSDSNTYSGTFNGQNFTISGLTINRSTAGSQGLFGDTAVGSTLENFNMTGANVTGGTYVGLAVGVNNATVTNVNVSGHLTGSTYVGGLLGISAAHVTGSSSSGTVTGPSGASDIGGLVGYEQDTYLNSTTIATSYSSATVTVPSSGNSVGGLVGLNGGSISQSYSSGAVNGGSGSTSVGGLLGSSSSATIMNTYAVGTVTGGSDVGGLIGSDSGGIIQTSYGYGTISGATGSTGGLIGSANGGSFADSYYNTSDGQSTGIGSNTSSIIMYNGAGASTITGLTPAQFKVAANFDSAWNFSTIWSTNGNTTRPELIGVGEGMNSSGTGTTTGSDLLSGTAYTNSGVTIAPGVAITFIFDGTVLGTTDANSSGGFSFSVPATDVGSGLLLTDTTDKGNLFFQSGSNATTFTGLDLWGSTLRILADTASNAALKTAITGLTGHGINYAVASGNLSTNTGVNLDIVSDYTVDGNLTAAGTFTTASGSLLTGSANATLQGTAVILGGNLNRTGSLTVKSTAGQILLEDVGTSNTPAVVDGLTLTATGAVLLDDSFLTLGGGDFTATGTGYTSTTDQNGEANGINLYNSTILAQGGNIMLTGTAGYTNPGSGIEAGLGVGIGCDGTTPAELGTTGSGNITIKGTFNQNITSTTFFSGVDLYSNGASSDINVLSVQNGLISITGNVLKGTGAGTAEAGASIVGVNIENGVAVTATGTGAVSVTGTTTAATTQVNGGNFQFIEGVGVQGNVSTAGGNITISGNAGTVNTSNSTLAGSDTIDAPASVGVVVDNNGSITAGDGATVAITGTGGSVITTGAFTGSSTGVSFNGASTLTLGSNDTLTISGTGGAVNAGNGSNSGDAETRGVHLAGQISANDGGSISVTGTGGILNISNATAPTDDNVPTSEGVTLGGGDNGGSVIVQGSTSVTFTGTGGSVTSSAGNKIGGSVGVNIGNNHSETDEISTVTGSITLTGTAGSAPSLGIGVAIHGFNGNTTEVTSTSGNIQITGTGGSGYTGTGIATGNYVPNDGVGIFDDVTLGSSNSALTISGKGGANSSGVVVEQLNDSILDATPTTPTLIAGSGLTVTSTAGNVTLDATTSASSATITSPGTLTIANSGGGTALFSDGLTASAAGAINLNGVINLAGVATIKSTGGDITIGTNGQVTDSGTGNNLSLVAGTSFATGHNFINNSSSGANAVQVSNGSILSIYSASPASDVFNGITTANMVFGATYPEPTPNANTEFFYGAGTGTATSDTLSGTAFSDSGGTFSAGDLVTLIFDGSVLGTTTTNGSGGFTFTVSSTDIGSGLVLTDGAVHGDTFFQSNSSAAAFTGVDIWGSTLRVIADAASNAALKMAIGSLTGNGINYGVSGANLSTTSGINLDIVSNYNVDGNLTASGSFNTEATSLLTGSANATLKGSIVIMTGSFDRTGSLTIDSTAGPIEINDLGTSNAPATVNGLTLNAVGGPAILDTSYVDLAGGSLSMSGTGSGTTLDGVDLFGTTVDAQGGNITLTGHAGYDSDSTDAGVGVSVDSSSLTTSGTGNIGIMGDGSAGTSGSPAVDTFMSGALVDNSTVTVESGAISITGVVTRGNSTGGIEGIEVNDSTVQATLAGGSITLSGNTVGSVATDSFNDGADVYCAGANFISTQAGAGIHISGTAGSMVLTAATDGPEASYGVTLGSNISTTGSAPIVITGTGGAVTDHSSGGSIQSTGVDFFNASTGTVTNDLAAASFDSETLSTDSGNVTITGTGGVSDNAGFGVAMFADSSSPINLQTNSGDIKISGTGGAGNPGTAPESATYEPNIGVALGDAINLTATTGNVTITGTGKNAPGIKIAPFAGYLNGTSNFDPSPTNPGITAGASLQLVSLSGAVYIDAALSAASTTIVSPSTLTILNSEGGAALTTGSLSATAAGAINLDNEIDTDGVAAISSSGGDITFGNNFLITGTGAGNNITIAAGTSLPHSHYILNHSEAGADAIQVSNGAQFFLYSADPTRDQLNGITVPQNNVVFGATYPSNNLPNGNGELFYVANANDVGPNPVGGGNSGGGGGNGGGGGGTTPPTDPTTVAAMQDGSGSNVVPPEIVPQNSDVQPPPGALPPPVGGSIPPFSFGGGTTLGQSSGGLADSSGTSSVVTPGDETVSSKDGGVGTNSNPAASSALGLALGPAVHNVLNLALTSIGDYTDPGNGGDAQGSAGGGNGETTLGDGDVVEIGATGGVKPIDPRHAPEPLKKALGSGVLNGLPGH